MRSVSRCGLSRIAGLRAAAVGGAWLVSALPADAQYPVTESFRNAEAPNWTMVTPARLTAAAPANDAVGQGWLRLTDAVDGQGGYAYFNLPIPASQGMHIEFEYAMYGSTSPSGGEGFTFFMFDDATSFDIGSFGGSNPLDTPTVVRLSLLFPDGRAPVTADYPVAAQSRLTIAVAQWHPETANSSFGAVIEQLGEPTGVIVESAVYSDSGGARWAAGRGGVASPIP